jgi:hypothetical protein
MNQVEKPRKVAAYRGTFAPCYQTFRPPPSTLASQPAKIFSSLMCARKWNLTTAASRAACLFRWAKYRAAPHHGVRSAQALGYLQHRLGRENLLNLRGGIDAWSHEVDPSVPIY